MKKMKRKSMGCGERSPAGPALSQHACPSGKHWCSTEMKCVANENGLYGGIRGGAMVPRSPSPWSGRIGW